MSLNVLDKVNIETYYDILAIPFDKGVRQPHQITSIRFQKTKRRNSTCFTKPTNYSVHR